jgi:tetratricopeptide (TPR) repeat protein
MQGLRQLYDHTGRRGEWKRLVEEIVPAYVDPATEGPLAGREHHWGMVTEYRVRLAMEELDWAEAERLQRVCVDWDRKRADLALGRPGEKLDDEEENRIRTLSVSISLLAHILRERGSAECVEAFQEDYELSLRIGDTVGAAVTAFNLGHAYMSVEKLRDLDKAKECYGRSLDLRDKRDRPGRGRCLGQLGLVALERFKEARKAKRPKKEVLKDLNEAARLYHEALKMIPEDTVNELAVVHNQLGNIYDAGGDLDRALGHYREAIRYEEMQGDVYGAGQTRFNVAVALADARRFGDALEYAKAALRNFESYGPRAAADIQKGRGLIAKIKKDLAEQGKK